jgi:hypothetical protein
MENKIPMRNQKINIILHNLSDDEYNSIKQKIQKIQKPQMDLLNDKFAKEGLEPNEVRAMVVEAISNYVEKNKTCIQANRNDESGVNYGYMIESMEESNAIIFSSSDKDDIYGSIGGFATLKFENNMKRMYVDVLCAGGKGSGTMLMNKIKDITGYLGMDEIFLQSLDSAFGFYVKMNFKCTGDDGMSDMIYHMPRNKSRKTRKNTSHRIRKIGIRLMNRKSGKITPKSKESAQ